MKDLKKLEEILADHLSKLYTLMYKEKFDLDFIVKKDKTLYLRYNSIDKFESLIKPYITEDMQYKIH